MNRGPRDPDGAAAVMEVGMRAKWWKHRDPECPGPRDLSSSTFCLPREVLVVYGLAAKFARASRHGYSRAYVRCGLEAFRRSSSIRAATPAVIATIR